MGLAGAKTRRKISKDPNNTKWSRNTDSFGHKILRSHGWEPGNFLGAKDAAHAEFLTAASATHIRTVLKDDNLGLGAKRNQGDECTGLDAFQQLLGRLNGKSEDVLEAEQKARSDVKMNLYINRKFGMIRFVRGGFLVGDQVQELRAKTEEAKIKTETVEASGVGEDIESVAVRSKRDKKSKKRKAEQDPSIDSDNDAEGERKKSRKRKAVDADDGAGSEVFGIKERKKDKKRRKEKEKEKVDDGSANVSSQDMAAEEETEGADSSEQRKQKKSKKSKKDKAKKSRKGDEASKDADLNEEFSKKKKRRKTADGQSATTDTQIPSSTSTGLSTPTGSGYSTPISDVPSRHLARKRFIAQKRLAVMDPAALNQIFMIKA
ncbi:Protein PXR1 [Pleurostoma richardsiae]|uniref:PinX1-related protein 1 n=1 Tax=Pleurostoma richardsiae TaxID=41990 RepID=A0AA38RAF3_9PEZI|nr:Protein PXR1 [Pleurostoma richardsiae]